MTLRERAFARFRPVATGVLRLDPESADAFASHLANANEGIHVVSQICMGPNALKSETLDLMLERWFRLLPEYKPPRNALRARPGPSMSLPALEADRALLVHARLLEVSLSQRNLNQSDALTVAEGFTKAAGPMWVFAQHSASTERRSQRDLCALLRAALEAPLDEANRAAAVYLNNSEA